MKLYSVFLISFFFFLTHGQQPIPSVGTIDHYPAFESTLIKPRNIDVWLPENYSENKKYAVVYMHDGSALFDPKINWNNQEWRVDETIDNLLLKDKIIDCIVVGIWNGGENRQSEYFPEKAFDMLSDEDKDAFYEAKFANSDQFILSRKVNSDNYLRFIVEELKPFIDTTYAVHTDQKHTIIAGSSYGGLISIYAICEYAHIFGKAICMSTHWTGLFKHNVAIPTSLLKYLQENLPDPEHHKIYFDHGTSGLDSLYGQYQLEVDKLLHKRGFGRENAITKIFKGANHSENAWSDRLDIPLTIMLENERK